MIRLAVRVARADAELVLAELLELAPSGVEETAIGEAEIEYAVYGAPGELPRLPDLEAAAAGVRIAVTSTEIPDDWMDRWRAFHRPLVLGDRLTVRPPWEPPAERGIDLVIDPGQAFGTGAHATTRLCLELMLEIPAAGSFLDLGCGSGVLAIAAARLGFAPVYAVDLDPASLAAARENASVNGVAIDVARHDVRVDATPAAGTIAANLLGPLLVAWAERLAAQGATPPERIIAGGLLATEAERVGGAFAALGLDVVERRERAEWAALLLRHRPA